MTAAFTIAWYLNLPLRYFDDHCVALWSLSADSGSTRQTAAMELVQNITAFLFSALLALLWTLSRARTPASTGLVAMSSSASGLSDLASLGRSMFGFVSLAAGFPVYSTLSSRLTNALTVNIGSSSMAHWAPLVATLAFLAVVFWVSIHLQAAATNGPYSELKRVKQELQQASAVVNRLQGQLEAAQQEVAAAEAASQQVAAEAQAAAQQAVAEARVKQLAATGMANFRGLITGLTPNTNGNLRPLAALAEGGDYTDIRQCIRECNVAGLARSLHPDQAITISNIRGLDYDDNPTVQDEDSTNDNYNTPGKLLAKQRSIAVALILLSHMSVDQAASVMEFLSLTGTMLRSSFAKTCKRMKKRQTECDAVLDPILRSVLGDAFEEQKDRKNAAFLIVSSPLHNVLS